MAAPSKPPFQGACPPPFLQESLFPSTGGSIANRLCAPLSPTKGAPSCCLACPSTSWLYPSSFETWYKAAEWINVGVLAVFLFLSLSYVVLPPEATRRHYLSVCLVITSIMITLGFIIPLAANPNKCYNEITPNDMYTSMTCAWSGAFLVGGAIGVSSWIFVRAVYMHLQIVWDMNPGKRFFYAAQVIGWGLPAIIFTATITVTGVSFRLGDQCHINHEHSLATFWGPSLGIAGLAIIIQIATFAYCLKIYLLHLWCDSSPPTENSASLPSYTTSLRTQSAKAVYRRVIKVVMLQWRGMVIVCFLVCCVVAFAVVFIKLDQTQTDITNGKSGEKTLEWIMCIIESEGDRGKCYPLANDFTVKESTVVAILILLSVSGFSTCGLLYRNSFARGWKDLFCGMNPRRNHEFVSLDALTNPSSNVTPEPFKSFKSPNTVAPSTPLPRYDNLRIGSPHPIPLEHLHGTDFKDPNKIASTFVTAKEVNSPTSSYASPVGSISRRERDTADFFRSSEERSYRSPSMSFSTPRAPGASRMSDVSRYDVDIRTPAARGGLGLHPPIEDDGDMGGRI